MLYKLLEAYGLSSFERLVLLETLDIKRGSTITYTELAGRIGRRNACRAVGNALGKNPLPLLIPCHRVVSSKGIGGYKLGKRLKKMLVSLESAYTGSS